MISLGILQYLVQVPKNNVNLKHLTLDYACDMGKWRLFGPGVFQSRFLSNAFMSCIGYKNIKEMHGLESIEMQQRGQQRVFLERKEIDRHLDHTQHWYVTKLALDVQETPIRAQDDIAGEPRQWIAGEPGQ